MGTRLKGRLSLLLFAFMVMMLAFPAMAFAQTSPTIQSDKADYSPGETVTLTGSNWQPGESVHIFVNDDQGKTWSRDADVTADANGQIQDQFQLPDWFVALYSVKATGASGAVATTTFTDANLKVAGTFVGSTTDSFTLSYQRYSGSASGTTCGGTLRSGDTSPQTLTISTSDVNVGPASQNCVEMTAPATSAGGRQFLNWTDTNGNVVSDTVVAGGGHRIATDFPATGTDKSYKANYGAANQAPVIASNNASRTVNEGQTATNTGTWSDANAGDNVTLSASVGTVTKSGTNASGTWSWSFGTTDGPDQSQTVTITANDGNGGVTQTTFSLTVNNVAPSATFNAPNSVNEGSNINLSLSSPSDPSSADTSAGFEYAFDCGDGSGYSTFVKLDATHPNANTASCSTTDNGTRTVKGKIRDKDGGVNEYTANVTINNVAPTANLNNNGPVSEGSPATVSFSDQSDPSTADTTAGFHYAYRCDGTPFPNDPTYAGTAGSTASTTCTFADNGSKTVRARIIDKDGGFTEKTTTVTVNNVAPTVTAPANQTSDEGENHSFNLGSFSDPGVNDNPWSVEVDWGDGSTHTMFDATSQGALDSQSHKYADDGTYTVSVKVTDKDGGSDTKSFTVDVANVAPVVTAAADQSSDEGASKDFNLGSFTDPGADGPWQVSVDWGDSSNTTFAASAPGTLDQKSHTYADNGTYTVKVTVAENGGAPSDTKTFNVTVANVAPTVTLDGPNQVDESATDGRLYTFTVTDPGPGDDGAVIDKSCGTNGHVLDGSYQYDQQTGEGSFRCIFPDGDATSEVSVKATDKDGGSDGDSQKVIIVQIANVAPTISSVTSESPINEGSSSTITVNASDPGDPDPLSYAFDCDNDNNFEVGPQAANTHQCPFADDGTYTVNVRVSDGDGGSATDSTTVTVNNVKPAVTAADDQSSDEGQNKEFDLGSFTDPGDDGPWHVTVDWGDGSTDGPFDASAPGALPKKQHTYDDNGTYTVTVTVAEDGTGTTPSGSASFKVEVANVAPSATFNAPNSVDEGSNIELSLSGASDVSNADTTAGFEYAFDCGNGSGYGAFSSDNTASCPTSDNGTRAVKGKIRDKDGGVSEYSASVTINNVAPKVNLTGPNKAEEGDTKTYTVTITDPGTDDTFHFPAGYPTCGAHGELVGSPDIADGSFKCFFPDGDFSTDVAVKVADDDGGVSTADTEHVEIITVQIANVAPSVTAAANQSSNEGENHSFNLGSFSDPGPDSPWAVDVDWGDSSTHTTFDETASGPVTDRSITAQSHTYKDNGTYTVTVTVTDKNGASDSDTFTVNVTNVKPTVAAPANDTGFEGTSKSFGLGSFSDPGVNDNPWHVKVVWGDGSPDYEFNTSSQGGLGPAPHAYDDNGTYTMSVTVTDKDGASDTKTSQITIDNVAPTATLNNSGPINEGGSATVYFTNKLDPSTADTNAGFHYAFRCDGTPFPTPPTYAGSGTADSTSCSFADNGTKTVRAAIIDRDGGYNVYTTNVVVNNAPPSVTAAANQSSNEGDNHSFDLGSFTDSGPDSPWVVDVNWGDSSTHTTFNTNSQGALGSQSHKYDDNGTYTVSVKVTDKDNGSDTKSFQVTVSNVAPTITGITSTSQNAIVGTANNVTFTGSATDPSVADTNAGFKWQWALDGGTYSTFGAANANTFKTSFTSCGAHTVSAKAMDKDNGVSAPFTTSYQVNAYDGSYKAPLVDGTTNKVQKGQVVPVKISVGCGTTSLTGLSPRIDLLSGNVSPESESGSTAVTTSVSAADTGQIMRPVDGGYIYNLQIPSTGTVGTQYTIRVNPWGVQPNAAAWAASSMYIVIELRK